VSIVLTAVRRLQANGLGRRRRGAPHPEDRKPEASPSGEPRGSQGCWRASRRQRNHGGDTLMFALLPVALIAGGYFYVTGGAVIVDG